MTSISMVGNGSEARVERRLLRAIDRAPLQAAMRLTLAYAALLTAWIAVSDHVVMSLVEDMDGLARAQSLKGVFWVLFSSGLLFWLCHVLVGRIAEKSKAVLEMGERFRSFVDAAPMSLFEATAAGEVTFLSIDRGVLGFDPNRARGLGWKDSIVPEDLSGYLPAWEAFVAAAEPALFQRQVRIIRPGGSIHWALIRVRRTSCPRSFIGVAVDITPWKEAERALETAQLNARAVDHARRQFLSNVSHELRTPLNAIIGFGDLLRGSFADDPRIVRDYAGDIQTAGQRLLEVLDDMMTCAQVEASALRREPASIEVDAEVGRAFRRLQSRFQSKFQEWTYHGAPGAFAFTDAPAFRQVLQILLDNAARYTPRGGRIRVEAEDRNGIIELTVMDSGPGFPAQVLEQAGAPFLRGEDVTRSKEAGLGLGLYLALKLAELMGGHLHLSNRASGGALAVLVIPSIPATDHQPRSLAMNRSRAALTAFRANPADIAEVFKAACQDIVENVGSTRASIWFFNMLGDAITCECLYDSRSGRFSSGALLSEEDFPAYFAAIRKDLRVVASDAANHPATAAFDVPYFIPNDIRSLLDHVVVAGRETMAVLCCEHCGTIKAWTAEDEAYLHQMSVLLGMALKARYQAIAA